MKKCLPVIIFLVFCFGTSSNAQQHLVDSLTEQPRGPMADSNRAVSLRLADIREDVINKSLNSKPLKYHS